MSTSVSIIKSSGEHEQFDVEKLIRSLREAKAPPEVVDDVVARILADLKEGMTTDQIYRHAFVLLRKYDSPFAAEYSLKKAIMELGPSGFPFERFISKILEAQGYRTQVGVIVRGHCVSHEVDVVAEKDDERILVEAKYHNSPDMRSDIKVALYVKARFDDITRRLNAEDGERYNHAWLITNTAFTSQAIEYAACAGLALTGWNYPDGRTLQDLIRATQSHPLTCLTSLSPAQKYQLLGAGTVLCREVVDDPTRLRDIGLSSSKANQVVEEGIRLCPISSV
jgi:hypothetical protein